MTEQSDRESHQHSACVSLIVIATGLYGRYLPDLVASAKLHVRGLYKVHVLSDERPTDDEVVSWLPWGHVPWPYPTLLRYRAISAYADVLSASDVLVYIDVDMLLTGEVDVRNAAGLISVVHPGFEDAPSVDFPYERREISRVCITSGQGAHYFAGGVQGGKADIYLRACESMAEWIQEDLDRGVIAVWHDESVWNKWCIEHPPSLMLDSSYCTPESAREIRTRIVALDKDHDRVRQIPVLDRWNRRLGALRRSVRSRAVRMIRRVVRT